jgi:serine/threonine protein phosphatase 1
VAAIHGESERLAGILEALPRRLGVGDKLVFLGNYVGYGPDVGGTLDRLIAFRRAFLALPGHFLGDFVLLRGWQEEMWSKLLQLQFAANPREVLQWMLDRGLEATLFPYGAESRRAQAAARDGVMGLTRWTASVRAAIDARPGHRALFNALKHAAITDDGRLLFVHAGFDPRKSLESQGDILWWGGPDILAPSEPPGAIGRVVRGFSPDHGGFRQTDSAVSLDAGSGFGGPLLAACFDRAGAVIDSLSA